MHATQGTRAYIFLRQWPVTQKTQEKLPKQVRNERLGYKKYASNASDKRAKTQG